MRRIAPRLFAIGLFVCGLALIYLTSIALWFTQHEIIHLRYFFGSWTLEGLSPRTPLTLLTVPVLVVLSWVFLFRAPGRLWRVGEAPRRRTLGRTALELGLVLALSVTLCAISWHFSTVRTYVVTEVGGQPAWSLEEDPARAYYTANGWLAREIEQGLGETTWNLDGSIRSQTRFVDEQGNRGEETRTAPPWFWPPEPQTGPTAPWIESGEGEY